jgi:hypothetical protein
VIERITCCVIRYRTIANLNSCSFGHPFQLSFCPMVSIIWQQRHTNYSHLNLTNSIFFSISPFNFQNLYACCVADCFFFCRREKRTLVGFFKWISQTENNNDNIITIIIMHPLNKINDGSAMGSKCLAIIIFIWRITSFSINFIFSFVI